MKEYDCIIIGAGVGGLSTASFLSKVGKNVLVIEKEPHIGGYATSFTHKKCLFNIGIPYLGELGPDGTITQFLNYFGEEIETKPMEDVSMTFIGNDQFLVHGNNIQEDLISYFPKSKNEIIHFFKITEKIFNEMILGGLPKPPYEMNLLEKISFGINSMTTRPTFMKYAVKDNIKVLQKLIHDERLALMLFGKYPFRFVFIGDVYPWEISRRGLWRTPIHGMKSIAGAMVDCIKRNNGEVLLNTEAKKINITNGYAKSVQCSKAQEFFGDVIISNAPLPHTIDVLLRDEKYFHQLRKEIHNREIFTSIMLLFLGIRRSYDFKGVNHITILDRDTFKLNKFKYTPQNCPISISVLERPTGQKDISCTIAAVLPAEYKDFWCTGPNHERGTEYKRLKEEVVNIILDRICEKLSDSFRDSILFVIPATPITFERYTNSKNGSFMGWDLNEQQYGKFIPQSSPIPNLFFVGQWVFPGFEIAGTMASGFYLVRHMLSKEGFDLEKDFQDKVSTRG